MPISVSPGTIELVQFPTDFIDIRVQTEGLSIKGIHVLSTNGAKITVIGVNDEEHSTDAFLAIPCQTFTAADGTTYTNVFKYFVFSAGSEGSFFNPDGFKSRFLIVPCGPDNDQIRYRL